VGEAPASEGQRAGSGRPESEEERLDRNLEELLGELRVALPGVQVLFAFLLVTPFNARFTTLTSGQKHLFLTSLLFAGVASALLIAPAAHHRLTFRLQDKKHLVLTANRLAIVGLGCLAIAMTTAIGLVTDVVFDLDTAVATSVAIGLLFAILWYLMPLRRRARSKQR
jgi:hypothetical protein